MLENTMKKKSKTKEPTPTHSLSRYALTGGLLGLYFGWFFRPADREVNFGYVLILAFIAALAVTVFSAIRSRPPLKNLLARFGGNIIKASLVLVALEGRLVAFNLGGKTAVIIFTVIMGVITGLLFAFEQKRTAVSSGKKQT
jgi:hypothetical protein